MGNSPTTQTSSAPTPKKNVDPNQRVVVVFGETGSGKSSIVGMLLDENESNKPIVSDSALGCTLDCAKFTSGHHIYYDTAGFGEGSQGSVTPNRAIAKLVKLLRNLEDGVNLLVYVVRIGKITETTEENYKLFVQIICQSKVPTILVITGCEEELEMGNWYLNNKEAFEKKYKFQFKDVISACASKGENKRAEMAQIMETLYKTTEERVKNSIRDHALIEPWIMGSFATLWGVISTSIFNQFRSVFHLRKLPISPEMKVEMIKLGIPEDKAIDYTNTICKSAT